jgi:hypothetical protein
MSYSGSADFIHGIGKSNGDEHLAPKALDWNSLRIIIIFTILLAIFSLAFFPVCMATCVCVTFSDSRETFLNQGIDSTTQKVPEWLNYCKALK